MSHLNHLTFRKIFTFLKFHTKISFSEMFALLDIRLTPLTVLLGQKMCCKSLKITSPDRICHFVITKNDNRQLKSYFTYQKAALWETTVRTFLFFLTCATKKYLNKRVPSPSYICKWLRSAEEYSALSEVEIRYTPSVAYQQSSSISRVIPKGKCTVDILRNTLFQLKPVGYK